MALIPENKKHEAQILAGTKGRKMGHEFENRIAEIINAVDWSKEPVEELALTKNIFFGDPAVEIVKYILKSEKINSVKYVKASWLGGLATSGLGHVVKDEQGHAITKSKSDIILELATSNTIKIIGISIKSCNAKSPTNAQLYFSTASAFSQLLRNNGIEVSVEAEESLKMFCGNTGYQPVDSATTAGRLSDNRRYFWEELPESGRNELETLFSQKQGVITNLLLRKAYKDDPFAPSYVVHKTKKSEKFDKTEIAIYSIDELVALSEGFAGFQLKPYHIRKGAFKNDPNEHWAPRFGVVQMQRGGQKQHPTQLQFNLQAGYFYKLAGLS